MYNETPTIFYFRRGVFILVRFHIVFYILGFAGSARYQTHGSLLAAWRERQHFPVILTLLRSNSKVSTQRAKQQCAVKENANDMGRAY